MPWKRLAAAGLHEIGSSTYRDEPAALAFALACLGAQVARREVDPSPLLWCLTERRAREWGAPYGPGLLAFGLDPALFLIVQTRTAVDAAWALEEGLKAQAFAAALGQIEVKAPLFARRLGLAAQASRTPCLLLSGHRAGALPGTMTRWRVTAAASGGAVLDASAPGAPSLRLTLERCRGIGAKRNWIVELGHGANGIRLAAASADRAARAEEQDQALAG
jgi:protein ImuA